MGFPFGPQGLHSCYSLDPMASGAAPVWIEWQLMWPKRLALAFLGRGDEDPGQGQGGTGIGYSVPGQNSSFIWGSSQAPTQSWRLLLCKGAAHPHPRKANATHFVRGGGRERMDEEREGEGGMA